MTDPDKTRRLAPGEEPPKSGSPPARAAVADTDVSADTNGGRHGLRLPLLARVVLALVLMGAVPTAVGLYQLGAQKDALLEQVQRTHIVAATSAADRVDAFLQPYLDLSGALASNQALLGSPGSAASQELVRGLLATRAEVAALGLFTASGETVLVARRPGLAEELPTIDSGEVAWNVADPDVSRTHVSRTHVSMIFGAERAWLRIVRALDGADGRLVLVVRPDALDAAVQALELGDQAQLVLAARGAGDGQTGVAGVLVGGSDALAHFPAAAVEQAASGNLGSSCGVYRDAASPTGADLVVAQAQVRSAPWFVLSRQPATVAEQARRDLQRAAWTSGALALALTLILATAAWTTVVRPIRRLAQAQRELVGGRGGGSEIADLEQTFELLRQRIRDSESLEEVFIGRYQVTDLIGSGAMGSVFRAWDGSLRRPVALKTIHMDSDSVDREKLMANLRDEAAITANIHQPNIVTVYDIEEQGHVAFIAMEFVEGVNLQTVIDVRGPLEERDLIPAAAQMARGLATAHAHGLVHHDVKPANVLLGLSGEVKWTDFGVSQLISVAAKGADVICGTPGFLAPECFEGGEYGPEADLWALGVVLYQCLTGRQPFRGRQLRATVGLTLKHEPDRLHHIFPDMDLELAGLVHALIAKDPEQRPASAAEVAELLEEMAERRDLTWAPDLEDLLPLRRSGRTTAVAPTPDAPKTELFSTRLHGGDD